MVEDGSLVFPKQVIAELDSPKGKDADAPLIWTRRNELLAARLAPAWATVREVLAKVPAVLDKDKPSGVDEADPYVLALALDLQRAGHEVTVLNEERRDRGDKMFDQYGLRVAAIDFAADAPILESTRLSSRRRV